MQYVIRRTDAQPELAGNWDGPIWSRADTLDVAEFRTERGDAHRPKTQARLLYDAESLYGVFRVEDRYVRAVHTEFNACVCRDSCVEFFVKPKADKGYFNMEFSCGGALLMYYIVDATPAPNGNFLDYTELTPEDGAQVAVYHSMPGVVEPEIQAPTTWFLEFRVPLALYEKYAGGIGDPAGQEWTANFYKCGDQTSHPHWASWAPIDKLSFHRPHCFAPIQFEA